MATTEELFDDLKQFISTTVSQSEERLRSELASREDLAGTERRLMQAIGDAMQEGNEATDKTLKDHERWLRRLDQRAA